MPATPSRRSHSPSEAWRAGARRAQRARGARAAGRAPGRVDEIGNARLVLGRVLNEQERLGEAAAVLAEAERAMREVDSASHRAAVWVAQGDLDARQGKHEGAALLYRRAAEALQDFHF